MSTPDDTLRAAAHVAYLNEDYASAYEKLAHIKAPTDADLWMLETAEGNVLGSVADDIEVNFETGEAPEMPERGLRLDGSAVDGGEPPPSGREPQAFWVQPVAAEDLELPQRPARPLAEWFGQLLVAAVSHLTGLTDKRRALWDRKSIWLIGLIQLSYWRDRLTAKNLHPAMSQAETRRAERQLPTPDFGQKEARDRAWIGRYRSADGTFTTPRSPIEGASGTPFSRHAEAGMDVAGAGAVGLGPDPRYISRELLECQGERIKASTLNVLSVAWIQFMVHGWADHEAPTDGPCHELKLEDNDPLRAFGARKLAFSKTVLGRDASGAPRSLNRLTHWWDASQLYGATGNRMRALRAFEGGHLRLPGGTLPEYATSETGRAQLAGFNKNWWLGLGLMHLLFSLEHNAICDRLKAEYPAMDDEQLFQTARLVNGAVMAKIHTLEWTPAVLDHPALRAATVANWIGLRQFFPRLWRKVRRPGETPAKLTTLHPDEGEHPIFGGLVGNPREDYGVPFSLSEEFVEVYRLHSMLPDTLELPGEGGPVTVPMSHLRQAASGKWMKTHAHDRLLAALGEQCGCALVLNNYPRFLQRLSVPRQPFTDLGAIDVARARERAVPRYNELRRALGLPPATDFDDISECTKTQDKLRRVYQGDVEKVDLLTGTLAEGYRPQGFGFGETMFMVFVVNASRRLQTDHFFTDGYCAANYTEAGLRWVDDATFKSVLVRHFPALAQTALPATATGFEPWTT